MTERTLTPVESAEWLRGQIASCERNLNENGAIMTIFQRDIAQDMLARFKRDLENIECAAADGCNCHQ